MPTDEALHHYVGLEDRGPTAFWRPRKPRAFEAVFLMQNGHPTTLLNLSQPFEIGLALTREYAGESTHVSIQIENEEGIVVHHSADLFDKKHYNEWRKGHRRVLLPAHALMAGRYRLSFWIWHPTQGTIEYMMNALCWDVLPDEPAFAVYPPSCWKGMTGPAVLEWRCQADLEIPREP